MQCMESKLFLWFYDSEWWLENSNGEQKEGEAALFQNLETNPGLDAFILCCQPVPVRFTDKLFHLSQSIGWSSYVKGWKAHPQYRLARFSPPVYQTDSI